MSRPITITDTTLRDAHQSLLATRMRTEDMLPVADLLDQAGYHSLEVWGGATFDACIRFLGEDPWERIRRLKEAIPDTPLQMLLRGQNCVGYRHYADDVVRRFVERAGANGIDVFRIFDALNDVRNMVTAIEAVKAAGKHAQGAISYTVSPVHDTEAYLMMAEELADLGVDSLCVKDMAGLLSPSVARELVEKVKESVGLPVQVHCHCTSGMATASYAAAVEAGADTIDCAISSLALGTSQPPVETMVAILSGAGYDPGLDLRLLSRLADHFREVRKRYAEFESQITVDTNVLTYQVPGGMLSNLEKQLRDQGALDRLEEVLAEIPRVREDFGYPPLVTPTSQIVGTQATLNVLLGRYQTITKESREYLRGAYGRPPGKLNPEVVRMALGDEEPITCRPADLLEPELEALREEAGDLIESEEDLLTYALFPQVARQFLQARREKARPVAQQAPSHEEVGGEVEAGAPSGPSGAPRASAASRLFRVRVNQQVFEVEVQPADGQGGVKAVRTERTIMGPAPADAVRGDGYLVKAALPGTVLEINCRVDDRVQRGDLLLTLEAMKMETQVTAPVEGEVAEIPVKVGDAINSGDTLVVLST